MKKEVRKRESGMFNRTTHLFFTITLLDFIRDPKKRSRLSVPVIVDSFNVKEESIVLIRIQSLHYILYLGKHLPE